MACAARGRGDGNRLGVAGPELTAAEGVNRLVGQGSMSRPRGSDSMAATEASPPADEIRRARHRACELGRSVFLFHDGTRWVTESRIHAVPMAGTTIEVPPDRDPNETANRGGC